MIRTLILWMAILGLEIGAYAQPYSPDPHTLGLWHLDSEAAGVTPDGSANGLDGLANGNTSFVPGTFGSAALFAQNAQNCALALDGISQHGLVAANSALDFGSGDFSFGAVIRLDRIENSYDPAVIFKMSGPGQSYYALQIIVGTTQPQFSGRGDGVEWNTPSESSLNLGQWTHVMCVRSGNDFIIYLNGTETGRVTRPAGNVSSSGDLGIGARLFTPTHRFFPGAIDEVQFWNRALTPAEVASGIFQPLIGDESGLTALYSFDECSGNNAADAVAGNSATLYNSPVHIPATWDTPGSTLGAHINCGTSALLRPSQLTVDAWVYADSIRPNDMLIVTSAKDFHGYRLFLRDGGKPAFDCQNGTYHIASSSVPISVETWYHLRGTFDGTTVKIFVDNQLAGSASGSLSPATYPLVIGADVTPPYVSDPFRGRVDEVRILDFALNADDCDCTVAPAYAAVNFPADDGSGTTLTDVSGNGNHGLLNNGASWSTGLCGGALDFDGVEDYVSVPSSTSLEIVGPFTIQFSMNPYAAPSNQISHLIGKPGDAGHNTDWSYVVIYGQAGGPHVPDGIWFQIGEQSGAVAIYDPTPVPLNEWTCVTAAFDGDTMKLIVNGELRVSQAVDLSMITNSNDLIIGRAAFSNERFYDGKLDAIRILPYDMTDGMPSLSVVGPGSGDEWRVGQFGASLEWSSLNLAGCVNVKLYRNGSYVMDIASCIPADQDTLSWNVPCDIPQGTDYQIYIESVVNQSLNDLGNSFWIREPYPAEVPEVVIWTSGIDAHLMWNEVTTDTLGNTLCPHVYLVFYTPDQNDTYYYLGYTAGNTFTHPGVVQFNPAFYYKVEVYVGALNSSLTERLSEATTRQELYSLLASETTVSSRQKLQSK